MGGSFRGLPPHLFPASGSAGRIQWTFAKGASSACSNFSQGNIGAGVADSVGVAIDTVAAAVAFVPGGEGASINAVSIPDKSMDAASRREQGASAAADGRKVWTATDDGVILPPGNDMGLVPTSAPNA